MTVHSSLKAFYHHLSLEFALMQGYDLEQDYRKFVDSTEAYAKPYVIIKESMGELAGEVTERDIAYLGLGIVTEGGLRLLKMYKRHAFGECSCENKPHSDDDVILTSMHSGSSDYLYIRDIKKFFEENPEA